MGLNMMSADVRPGAWMRRVVMSGGLVIGACASGTSFLAGPPVGLDLNGVWRLNDRLTDEQAATQGGSERPGRVRQRGGGGSPGGRVASGGGMVASAGPGGIAARPAAEFVLSQTDSSVTFAFASKNSVTVPTNGRKVTAHSWPDLGEVELKARWTDDGLRLERTVPGGGSVVEMYSRPAGADRLIVSVGADGPSGKRSLVRVYDRVQD